MKKKPWMWFLAFLLVSLVYGFMFSHFAKYSEADDPDFYYHLSIAKRTASQGLLRSIPEVEDIGWNSYYPDKDFLFHQILAAAHKVSGEEGARFMRIPLGLMFLFALLWVVSGSCEPVTAAGVVLGTVLMNPRFLSRLTDLRPYVLAEIGFIFLVGGLLRRKPLIVFLAGLAYTLGYSAFFLPLAIVLAFGVLGAGKKTLTAAGVLGIGLAILVHPYFPSNLVMSFKTLEIASQISEWGRVSSGQELEALPLKYFLKENWILLFLCANSAFLLLRDQGSRSRLSLWLVGITASFWALGLVNGKAIEYSIPLTAILVAEAVSLWKMKRFHQTLVTAAIVLVQIPLLLEGLATQPVGVASQAFATLSKLPSAAEGKKVFSCEWGNESYLLYSRPGVRMVDILDPFYLRDEAPEKLALRTQIKSGGLTDPRRALRDIFHADYFMCGSRNGILAVDRDPGFLKLYPPSTRSLEEGEFALYELNSIPPSEMVREFRVNVGSESQEISLLSQDGHEPGSVLSRASLPEAFEKTPGCLRALVSQKEIQRHAGAKWIGIGGAPDLEIFRGGKSLAKFKASELGPGLVGKTLPLATPLRSPDLIEVQVCPAEGFRSQYFSLSFWKEDRGTGPHQQQETKQ